MSMENISHRLYKRWIALYSNLVLKIYKRRIGSYHKENSIADDGVLHRSMSDKIEKISDSEKTNSPVTKIVTSAIEACAMESSGAVSQKYQSIPVLSKIWPGLAHHFKKNKTVTVSNSCMSEKLKERTWEHVHSALRLARQGNQEQAQFHVDIATNALKELAHYISVDEFKCLSSEIEESLKRL